MVVRDIMTPNPACCLPGGTAQAVARKMCENNVGSIPVIIDQESRKLTGIITDRDLWCSIVAKGLDPASTPIREHNASRPGGLSLGRKPGGLFAGDAKASGAAHSGD